MTDPPRPACAWCHNLLLSSELVLCVTCRNLWRTALTAPRFRDRLGREVADEGETVNLINSPHTLADDMLELANGRRVRVLSQHTGVEVGYDAEGEPCMWETVVVGGADHLWVRRFVTEGEARAAHAIVLAIYATGYTLGEVL